MYLAILFDLDGTLTESGIGITRCVQYALEKIGKPEPDVDKLLGFVGPPLKEQFMKYADVDEETALQAVCYYRERYSATGIYENRPYPGIEQVLAQLHKNYILAVASSKPEAYVRQILDHFQLTSYFDEIVGAEMNGARTQKKDVIAEALHRLQLEQHRDEVLMIGDKEHDVLGAREEGVPCLAVAYGYGTREELEEAGPTAIVDTVEELGHFFG
ncbi:MAG: HAD family hydrolase [Blautia sp.]|nr:HAD family hydrolase [Blautia sp.]